MDWERTVEAYLQQLTEVRRLAPATVRAYRSDLADLRSFAAEHTRVIEVGGHAVGSIAVRPEPGERWIEHFYLATRHQGRGIGGEVLRSLLDESSGNLPFRLNVLQGSAAGRLYERHGFVVEREDEIDVFLVRTSARPA